MNRTSTKTYHKLVTMFPYKTVLIVLVFGLLTTYLIKYLNDKPDLINESNSGLNVAELIEKYNYPLEIHEVTTDDGYILQIHRIPHGKANTNKANRIPVLLMHGILNSAAEFVHLGPDKALSFLLAERNYDVWLGNARGTTWSRKHTLLDPDKDQKKYWNFTLHEIGLFDVPSIIDYILKETQQPQLHYIGYSQGSQVFFAMASERPGYIEKVRLMTALAPAIYMNNSRSPVRTVLNYFQRNIEQLFYYLDIHEIGANEGLYSTILRNICHENSYFVQLCLHHIFLLHGYNYDQTNKTMLSTIFYNTPAGSSSKQHNHLYQHLVTGRFAQYDFGPAENVRKYGQAAPPIYDLSKATLPVAVYHAHNDWMVQPQDIENGIKELPNVVKKYVVPHDDFNHNDFLHGIDANKLLYDSVIDEMDNY